jgi:hypothetical protein
MVMIALMKEARSTPETSVNFDLNSLFNSSEDSHLQKERRPWVLLVDI